MAKVLSFCRTIRNNWKKSLVGAALVTYGVSYSKDAYDTKQLMREYCKNVAQYGDSSLSTNLKPRHVTVILNPVAKKGKAKKLFKDYCEPLLHLAGIAVTIIQTESENAARKLIMDLDTPTDAIIVAGGDGTLSDVLTGLVRKYNANMNLVKQCPIGILPLGQTSRVAKSLYHEYDHLSNVKQILEATIAIINEKYKMMDIIEVEPIEHNSEEPVKPIYAMGMVEWGAWKDAHALSKKYWYWGSLKKYVTYILNGFKNNLNQYCNATIKYTPPCDGCSRCSQKNFLSGSGTMNKRWWHVFVPRNPIKDDTPDYSKITNTNCGIFHELPVSTSELHIEASDIDKQVSSPSSLKIEIGPKNINYFSFVNQGWKQENSNKLECEQIVEAKNVELIPQRVDKECTLHIDNEEYELKPVNINLISRAVKVFHPDLFHSEIYIHKIYT